MTVETVLVTGAGGFIGSHLVEALLEYGSRVRAMARYTSNGSVGFLDEAARALNVNSERLEIFHGDIRDARAVKQAAAGCRRIFHLAALIGIPYSYVAPDSYVAVNVQGMLHVLEAARDLGVERVVVTSTSEVYGTAQYTPIDEKHPLNAQSPYAATKVGADQLALSYQRSYGLPVTIVRPFNTYGPRQSARAVIPTIVAQALAADTIRLGSLDPVRDFVYVKDTVAGFIALADSAACVGKVTNLATGAGVSVGEVVERVLRIVGRNVPVLQTDERRRPEASEVYRLLGSARQAYDLAGWRPQTSLDEGLRRTVEWVRANLRSYRALEYRI
jgi:NAD dependent epimerase/dehydratase